MKARKSVNKELVLAAKQLVKLIEEDECANELMNTLNGIEKRINNQRFYDGRHIEQLEECIQYYNQATHSTINSNFHTYKSGEVINYNEARFNHHGHNVTIYKVFNFKSGQIYIEERYNHTEYIFINAPNDQLMFQDMMAEKLLKGIAINGLRYYINRNISPSVLRWDDKDRPEYNLDKPQNYNI